MTEKIILAVSAGAAILGIIYIIGMIKELHDIVNKDKNEKEST